MATEPVNDVAIGRPPPALLPFVERYIGYRAEGWSPGIHRGLPGHHLTFIISLGDPVDIAAMPDPKQPPGRFGAFVAGLHDGPATIAHDGSQYGISLALTPAGARALFGLPAGELAGLTVSLDAVLGRRTESVVDALWSAPGWADRFSVLDGALADLAARAGARATAAPRPEVIEAWTRLVSSGGRIEVGSLARELGWSRRHLGEWFRREIGLAPKALARVVRFQRAKRMLQSPARPGLAEVAAAAGYYDQAHLNRDWRDLAGCSPTVWMAEELPPVQDEAVVAGAR